MSVNNLSWACHGTKLCNLEILLHKCADLIKSFCRPCLNFLVEKICLDLHYINSKFIVT